MSNRTALYFFLSVDVIDSTALKTRDAAWAAKILGFYGIASTRILRQGDWHPPPPGERLHGLPGAQVWKLVGDEVLFWTPVSSLAQLDDTMLRAFVSVHEIRRALTSVSFDLGIKVSCWVAKATDFPWHEMMTQKEIDGPLWPTGPSGNMRLRLDAPGLVDFIGPTIDEGFRMSDFGVRGAITINPELAWLLAQTGSATHSNYKVVSLQKLKGVWNGDRYPIIWYHENWNDLLHTDYGGYQAKLDHPILCDIDRVMASRVIPSSQVSSILAERKMLPVVHELLGLLTTT